MRHLSMTLMLLATLAEPTAAGPCNLPPNLPEYFKARYGIAEGLVTSRSENYPGTPACLITVHEEMHPPANPGGDTPLQRARSVAWAIVEREKDLLGIPDLTELKEREPLVRGNEFIGIGYERHIGGVGLANMHLYFRFRGDGTLYQFEATLVPVPPEVYEAVKRERLSADQIKAIVARDLGWPGEAQAPAAGEPQPGPTGRPLDLMGEPILMALAEPPYLRWGVTASKGASKPQWSYWVNAFSGEILLKNCTARTFAATPPGQTPCD